MIALAFIGGCIAGPIALITGISLWLLSTDNTPDDLPYGDVTRLPDDYRAAFERECG